MSLRTDLAIEKNSGNSIKKEVKEGNIIIEKIEEKEDVYITLSFPEIMKITNSEIIENEIINILSTLIPNSNKNLLAVGLGNTEITADSIGPLTASKLLATRHIMGEFAENIGLKNLNSVSIITPSVLGKTGIESAEIIKSVVSSIKPKTVIVIDALCSNSEERLFKTIQFTNTGITPGSGVKNSRKGLNHKTLGVPVIAIGIPTVMDIGSFVGKNENGMIVTPKDADILNQKLCEILSRAINIFLQDKIEKEIILSLV